MRILVSNDDGHFSPGIAALELAARTLSDDVWVVAPDRKRSSMGHSLSLHNDFTVTRLDSRRYICSGTPVDGVIAALAWLLKDSAPPDLVLAGINDGRNIGEDIAYSGTMAIAREASFWGIPAVAFSGQKNIDFQAPATKDWLSGMVRGLGNNLSTWHKPDHWLSINLPTTVPAPIRYAVPGRAKIAATIEAIVEEDDGHAGVTKLRYSGGRHIQVETDDELSRLEAGYGTIYRLCWNNSARVEDSLLDLINLPSPSPARSTTGYKDKLP